MPTIKETLKDLLKENKDALQNGEILTIRLSGASMSYVKLAVYTAAKELGLQITVSVKDGILTLRQRQIRTAFFNVDHTIGVPEEDDSDLDVSEITGIGTGDA